jgi:hypothetical protein
MKTVNSLSGGKTSSYIAVHYPSDYNVFALVRTDDTNCMFLDSKVRQIVSDKLGTDFIGTLEDDTIIYTMLDLEQMLGTKIDWVTGKTFDEIILRNGKKYLPNLTQRFCTTEMKLQPLFDWWRKNINKPVEMRIGFRANEISRAERMINKTNLDGFSTFMNVIGKTKTGNSNKWEDTAWQKPIFPLITDRVFKDKIEEFWKDKPVRFAYMNNCVGCFHRNEILLKKMSEKHPNKFQWFCDQEKDTGYAIRTFKNGITYEKIKNHKLQIELFDEDFNECDSGYCGL